MSTLSHTKSPANKTSNMITLIYILAARNKVNTKYSGKLETKAKSMKVLLKFIHRRTSNRMQLEMSNLISCEL